MKHSILFVLFIFSSTLSFSMGVFGKKDYTLVIVDKLDALVIEKEVMVILDRDTLNLKTNSKGQITIPIKYSYPCQSGRRLRRIRKTSPNYHPSSVTIICGTIRGSFSKNWKKYFRKSKHTDLDRYDFISGKLI